jgi:hypothetical protein
MRMTAMTIPPATKLAPFTDRETLELAAASSLLVPVRMDGSQRW